MLVSLLFHTPCAVPKQTSRSCALECCRSTQLRQQLTQRRIVSVTRDQQLLAFLRGIVEETAAGFRTIVALFHLCLQTRRHVETRAQPTLKNAKNITIDIEPGHICNLKRPEERQPKAEAAAHHFVDRLRCREAFFNTCERFAEQ